MEVGGLYPTIARINHSWSYTLPTIRYGKLTVLPQPFQIRISFFFYGCWTSGMWREAFIPPLPGLTILAALMPPGATPCPLSSKITVVPQLFQIRVSFFLYGCWTSGMCMKMSSIPPLPESTTLAALMPSGATSCPPSGKLTVVPQPFHSVADPDPRYGIRCLFDPWIRDPE